MSSSVGGAGSAVKGMLADFDELNVLTKNSGGGGGGGANSGYASFVDEQLEGASGGLAERLRNAFLGQDWETLGTELGNAINSIFSEERFAEIGANIGEKINALFTTTYWTLNAINFQNIGGSIATFLNNALSNIDFSNLGGIVATKFTVLPELIVGAINKLDFGTVGKSIGDFLKGAIQHFKEFYANVDWGETAWNLIKGLIDAIVGLDIPGIVVDLLSFAGTVIGSFVDGLGTLLLDIADVLTDPNTWRLVKAWLQDLPTVIKNYAIKAANALVQPIVDKLNDLIDKYNNSWFGEHFGKIEPISFELIPEIPEEEVHKHVNETRAQIEAETKANPAKAAVTPEVENPVDPSGLVKGPGWRPASGTHGKKIGEGTVEIVPGVDKPLDAPDLAGKNTGVYSTGSGLAVALGVRPELGDRSKLTGDMNKYVIRKDSPWSALVNPIYNTAQSFFTNIKKWVTGVTWKAPVNPTYNTGKSFFDNLTKNVTGKTWKAPVNPIYNTGKDFFDKMKTNITGKTFSTKVDTKYGSASTFFDTLSKNITGKTFSTKVDPKYGSGTDFFDKLKTNVTGVTKTIKVNPALSVPSTYTNAVKSATAGQTMTVTAKLSIDSTATRKAISSAMSGASAKVSLSIGGQTAQGEVKTHLASGGLAYGLTSAIIGEYAGAKNNPEVVAPLNKLQGILERSNMGGNKDTMTREQANTMIGLLKELTKKETVVRPSVELGQVVDRSLKAYART